MFGTQASHNEHLYEASFSGPLHILGVAKTTMDLVATHQDPSATLDLTMSAQALSVDTTVSPNVVSGTASFFSRNGRDMLFCKFHGTMTDLDPATGRQEAYVHTVFTGGQGRFSGATGTGAVEAELFPMQARSAGKIKGTVILP